MTIEKDLNRIAASLEELVRTLQQTINPLVQQRAAQTAPPQQAQAPLPPPAQTAPPMVPPEPAAAPPASSTNQMAPPMTAPASAAPPQPDNVVPMQPPAAPGPLTRDQLNSELMAVVAKLGGTQAAAAQVMNLLTTKYGSASLEGIAEDKYSDLLTDVRALTGG